MIVDVLPVVAPPVTAIGPLFERTIEGTAAPVTVTALVVDAVTELAELSVPLIVTTYVPGVVVDVEPIVNTACNAVVPVMLSDFGLSVQVIGLVEFDGAVVTVQARPTVPEYPPDGVTLIVEELPVVAPAASVMGALFDKVKLGVPITVTVLVVDSVTFPVATSVPVIVTT